MSRWVVLWVGLVSGVSATTGYCLGIQAARRVLSAEAEETVDRSSKTGVYPVGGRSS